MPLIYQKIIKRSDLKDNPDVLYVFGDNMERKGFGGQAAEMRGEPNAVGIVTKKKPSMADDAFFTKDDYALAEPEITRSFSRLKKHIDQGGIVVWPSDDIGTGRAQLPERAPTIWQLICNIKDWLT